MVIEQTKKGTEQTKEERSTHPIIHNSILSSTDSLSFDEKWIQRFHEKSPNLPARDSLSTPQTEQKEYADWNEENQPQWIKKWNNLIPQPKGARTTFIKEIYFENSPTSFLSTYMRIKVQTGQISFEIGRQQVVIRFPPYSTKIWAEIWAYIAPILYAEKLLQENLFGTNRLNLTMFEEKVLSSLIPASISEISFSCSCEISRNNPSGLCDHIRRQWMELGNHLQHNPMELFILRGQNPTTIFSQLYQARAKLVSQDQKSNGIRPIQKIIIPGEFWQKSSLPKLPDAISLENLYANRYTLPKMQLIWVENHFDTIMPKFFTLISDFALKLLQSKESKTKQN